MNRHIPIDRLRLFSGDGHVYQAFGHLIAARVGTLLLVPPVLVLVGGGEIVSGCPVPYDEVLAVLDHPVEIVTFWDQSLIEQRTFAEMNDAVQQLKYLGIDPADCDIDQIMSPQIRNSSVLRLVHPCGLRYAVVP
jgi:hypothetical protein